MANEDLTTYTELDPNSQISETSARVTAAGMARSAANGTALYKDFGVNNFDSLSVKFTMRYSTGTQVSALGGGVSFSGSVPGNTGAAGFASTDIWVSIQKSTDWRVYLSRGNYVATAFYDPGADLSIDTNFYFWLQRNAGNDTVNLKIYSDSGYTTLLTTLSVSGFSTTKWRYCVPMINYADGAANDVWDGYVESVNLSAGAFTSGGINHMSLLGVS